MILTRVLLAENHTLVRAGLCALLRALPNIEVVAEAGDGHEALRLIAEHRPDLVLLDIGMPGLNGLEVAVRSRADFPHTRILFLSVFSNEEYVRQALGSGASGYLLKDAALPELELALRTVLRGEIYLSPRISTQLVASYLDQMKAEPHPLDRLTLRQREVLQLIAEGRSTQQIAATLIVSVKTVETHRAQLMERLGIYEIAGLVRYAIAAGLIPLEEPELR